MTNALKEKFLLELDGLDLPWVKKNEHDSENSNLNWLPVAKLSGGRFLLGLTAEGDWARSTKSAVQTISDEAECVFFLPILEDLPEVVRRYIVDGLKSYKLPEELIETFPFEKIVIEGLRSHSEHWSGLALRWVELLPRSSLLTAEVEVLSRTGETQRIRHAARKIVKKLEA